MPTFDTRVLRRTVLRMAQIGATPHAPCALSIVDILAVLYRSFLRFNPDDPLDPCRDYLVLSKGHGVMAQYACLRELGWISEAELQSYCADGSSLRALCEARVPGLEVTSGSLGHGLSVAVGLALAAKWKRTGQRCFAVLGDGELNEGPIWEALLFAAHHGLNNLVVIVDANGFQAMGRTGEILDLGSIAAKLRAFGLETLEENGHDEAALESTLRLLLTLQSSRPRALVAHTVKGKGVSFMEGDNRWHYTRLTPETFAAALAELNSL